MGVGESDKEGFLLRSGPRSGLKREFVFAVKSQAEFSGSFGRTRSGKVQDSQVVDSVSRNSNRKRFRRSDVKDLTCDLEQNKDKTVVEIPVLDIDGQNIVKPTPLLIDESENCNVNATETTLEENSIVEISTRPDDNVTVIEDKDVVDYLDERVCPSEYSSLNVGINCIENADVEMVLPSGEDHSVDEIGSRTDQNAREEDVKEMINDMGDKNGQCGHMNDLDIETKPVAEVDSVIFVESTSDKNNIIDDENEIPNTPVAKSPVEDVSEVDNPVAVNNKLEIKTNNEIHTISPTNPMRRFTRSVLKTNAEQVEISTSVSAGSGTSEEGRIEENVHNEVKIADATSPLRPTLNKKLELKMSKKIAVAKIPSNVKELLATNLLEGLPVKYVFRLGVLHGVIKGCGILCYCDSCEGRNVVSSLHFELHAGSSNKNAPKYIYLENGNTIRDVLMTCRNGSLDALEATIQSAISSSPQKKVSVCHYCHESFIASQIGLSPSACEKCTHVRKLHESQGADSETMARKKKMVKFLREQNPKKSHQQQKPENLPKAVPSSTIQQKKLHGRLTKKDLRLHKLVFMEDGLPEGTVVAYYARGQRLLEGYKQGNGIFCRCCNRQVSASQFEAHAGWAARRKPYLNIYTSNGVSLHELAISLLKGRKSSSKQNDDLCTICADGGDLLCCDTCPRSFHRDCLDLPGVPSGDWYCKYCQNMFQKEKFVEHNVNAIAAGRVVGVDPIEQISNRCIRIVKTSEAVIGGCVLCRSHDFSKLQFGPRTVMLCDQCEREFHVGCLKIHNMDDLKELPKGKWFCCSECSDIHESLQKLLLNEPTELHISLLDTLRGKHEKKGLSVDGLDVRWRLLSGKFATSDSRLLLSKAVAIFHESFDPIVDATTGRDLIPSMVYGRNLRDQEFGGMYCAILTVNSSVVSAGILRIFGQEAAEIPLVATRNENQGQGYFQCLFSCIEQLLATFKVKHLLLPAAEEAESIWIKKFGFKRVSPEELSECAKGSHIMTFQGTSILQKPVPKYPIENETNIGS